MAESDWEVSAELESMIGDIGDVMGPVETPLSSVDWTEV